jgi:hypothetical protein
MSLIYILVVLHYTHILICKNINRRHCQLCTQHPPLCVLFCMLGVETRASHMLSKCSTTQLHPCSFQINPILFRKLLLFLVPRQQDTRVDSDQWGWRVSEPGLLGQPRTSPGPLSSTGYFFWTRSGSHPSYLFMREWAKKPRWHVEGVFPVRARWQMSSLFKSNKPGFSVLCSWKHLNWHSTYFCYCRNGILLPRWPFCSLWGGLFQVLKLKALHARTSSILGKPLAVPMVQILLHVFTYYILHIFPY